MKLLGIVLIVISLALFKIGIGALRDTGEHMQYGVESEKLHAVFSWAFIIGGIICASAGGALLV